MRRYPTEEATFYASLSSWGALLACLGEHAQQMQQALAVHTSTACQPQKAPGVVEDLLVAGLREAHVTLDLPALFTAGDAPESRGRPPPAMRC